MAGLFLRLSIFNKKTTLLLVAVFLLTLDRFLKSLALAGFAWPLVGRVLTFAFAPNYFIAFSLPVTGWLLNLVIALIIVGLLGYLMINLSKLTSGRVLILELIILGALSNFYDRLIYGYVVDYIDMAYFTIFNVADVMISLGVALWLYQEIKKTGKA